MLYCLSYNTWVSLFGRFPFAFPKTDKNWVQVEEGGVHGNDGIMTQCMWEHENASCMYIICIRMWVPSLSQLCMRTWLFPIKFPFFTCLRGIYIFFRKFILFILSNFFCKFIEFPWFIKYKYWANIFGELYYYFFKKKLDNNTNFLK